MKRLKPIFPLLLCLLLCLAACGGLTGTPAQPSASPGAETSSPTEAAAPTEKPPEATEAPSTEPTAKPTPEPTEGRAPEDTPGQSPEAAPEPTPEPAPDNTPDPTPTPFEGHAQINTHSPAVLRGTADMGQEYIDSIIFLGDSTTYGLKYYEVLKDGKQTKQVWTPSNGTLTLSDQGFVDIWYPDDDEEISIRAAVERKKPERMIITLGVNGVSFMEQDYFISEYTDLVTSIQEISPDTLIILQSIFPVASNWELQKDINNKKICDANTWILSVAEATGVKYLNTYTVLIGDDGYMVNKYQNGDGLHLNEEGFRVVLDYIRTHGYEGED